MIRGLADTIQAKNKPLLWVLGSKLKSMFKSLHSLKQS
jgi:hypothetical protein